MWPFLRLFDSSPSALTTEILARAGFRADDLARPETRLPHRLMMDVLRAWVRSTGDETVGLRAGACVEPGDLETLDRVACSGPTLRDAIESVARYMHILNEAAEISLVDVADGVLWRHRILDDGPWPRAANDFVVVSSARMGLRWASLYQPPREVHFAHEAPADLGCYAAFSASKLRFGMPHNGFVLERSALGQPTRSANARMRAVFEKYARELSERTMQGIRGRAREEIRTRIGARELCMESVAAALAMSVPTLRRRLEGEDTTFSDLVDDVRRDLAEQYLREPQRSITEIASLLGFAHAPAFHKAYRRWTGVTPSERRSRI